MYVLKILRLYVVTPVLKSTRCDLRTLQRYHILFSIQLCEFDILFETIYFENIHE